MDDLFDRLYEMTKGTVDQLDHLTSEQLALFVEVRQAVIDQLSADFSEVDIAQQHRQKIDEIVAFDEIIECKLLDMQTEVGQQINKTEQHRNYMNKYHSPYSMHSIFFDKKN
jgi:hypothetical protein